MTCFSASRCFSECSALAKEREMLNRGHVSLRRNECVLPANLFICVHAHSDLEKWLYIFPYLCLCRCTYCFLLSKGLLSISNVTLYMSTGVTLCVATVYVWTAGTALWSHDWVVIRVFEAERASKGSLFTTGVWKSWAGSLALQGWIMLPVGLSPLPLQSSIFSLPLILVCYLSVCPSLSLSWCYWVTLCFGASVGTVRLHRE